MTLWCWACKKDLPEEAFAIARSNKGRERNFRCRDCMSSSRKAKRDEDAARRATLKRNMEKWRQSPAGTAFAERTKDAPWRHARLERALRDRLRKYEFTVEQFRDLMEAQDYRCACCLRDFDKPKDAHIDHCHASNVIRGLLCKQCNMAIGLLGDSAASALAAAAYLVEAYAQPDPNRRRHLEMQELLARTLLGSAFSEAAKHHG